jgi:hypothetical protein
LRYIFGITEGLVKRLGETVGAQQGEIRVLTALGFIFISVTVHSQHAACVFHDNVPAFIETKHACNITVPFTAVPNLRLIDFFRKMIPN